MLTVFDTRFVDFRATYQTSYFYLAIFDSKKLRGDIMSP